MTLAEEANTVMHEAAAEIERLRAQNSELTDLLAAMVSQLDFVGCTCTFQTETCCAYAKAEALLAALSPTPAIIRGEEAS